MEFDKSEILAQLNRIISDKSFSRSKINVRLLKFLVASTLEEKELKETTIGIEFFGTKYDPVKLDNKVRVYVYHLRKKLDEYYVLADENQIRFHIKKGQYKVQFEKHKKDTQKSKGVFFWIKIMLAVIVICGILVFSYQKPVNEFWQSLMKNNFATTVIFGDYFTIEGPTLTSKKGIIRDYEINNEIQLQEYLDENPAQIGLLKASAHHYFNWMAPYVSKNITEFWGKYDYDFDIIQISEWNVAQLEKANLVYFGQSKSMGILKNILEENFPQFSYKSQKLLYTNPKTKKTIVYNDVVTKNDKIIDYTVVAKISIPSGNELRFFLSDQDCGAISALQYFTQKDSVQAFYKRHQLDENQDFIALFKVSGWKRKSYDMEFVLLDKK